MKNQFEEITITINETYKVTFAIDHKLLESKNILKDMHNFWVDADFRLSECNGNILKAVLGHAAEIAYIQQVSDDLNSYGVMESFNELEGWCPMDGSFGILLKHIDEYEFYFDPANGYKTKKLSEMPKPPEGNI